MVVAMVVAVMLILCLWRKCEQVMVVVVMMMMMVVVVQLDKRFWRQISNNKYIKIVIV